MKYTQNMFLTGILIYGITTGIHNSAVGKLYAIAIMLLSIAIMLLSLVLGYLDIRRADKELKQLEQEMKKLEDILKEQLKDVKVKKPRAKKDNK